MALTRLGTLPSRPIEPGTEEVARDAMYRALRGVTKYGLGVAADSVLQNALGHTFFPTPVELRRLCDEAMTPHRRQAERVALRQKLARENAEYDRVLASRTPEAIARVKAAYAGFCASYETGKDEEERAHIRARYGMTPERMAEVPDLPAGTLEKLKSA